MTTLDTGRLDGPLSDEWPLIVESMVGPVDVAERLESAVRATLVDYLDGHIDRLESERVRHQRYGEVVMFAVKTVQQQTLKDLVADLLGTPYIHQSQRPQEPTT